jgi:putative NADPH-quinone reductase
MQAKKIFVFLGHPDKDTYTGALADAYETAARAAGHEVRRSNIGDLQFDPILHKGYKVIQQLEPDLVTVQGNITWADHTVIIYPNWWNTMPALLKGFFDRAWIPGFAFNFDKQTKKLIQRLKGKTAHVIIVSGTYSPFMIRWKFGDFKNEIERGILEFSGFRTKVTTFGPAERCADAQKNAWLETMKKLGTRAK